MPVDQATLDKYIADVAGDDQELATTLRERLGKSDKAASNFVGGFMRNADYTTKTQDLAKQRQSFEAAQTDYENRLSQADQEKNRIMKDLAGERITGSRAMALLKTVKEAYGLTDDDLPGLEDVKATERTGRVVDSTPDLDERFKSFEERLMDRVSKQLIPEISGLAILGPVWNEISYEHQELFGKRLGKQEQAEILKEARDSNKSLEQVWADKYQVSDKRLEKRDETNKAKWQRDWEDERAKKDQEAALRGVSNHEETFDRQSPVFKKDLRKIAEERNTGETGGAANNPAHSDAARERGSAADRAAAKFVARQRSGQLGKPLTEAANA